MSDKGTLPETGIRTKFRLMPPEEIRVPLYLLLFGTIWVIGIDQVLARIDKEPEGLWTIYCEENGSFGITSGKYEPKQPN